MDSIDELSVHYGWTTREKQRVESYAEEMSIGFYMWAVTEAFKLDKKETRTPGELYQQYLKHIQSQKTTPIR